MRYFQLVFFIFCINNVYAGPYIEKGDPLFEPVSKMTRVDQSERLKAMVDKGINDALFWYAASIESKNILKHAESYQYYKQAAEKGNPYAMLRISGKVGDPEYDCEHIGWPCDSSWKDQAIDKLIALKDQGDVKAYYYYNKHSRTVFSLLNPFSDTMSEEEMIKYAADRNYYTPLVHYLFRYKKKTEKVDDEIIAVLDNAASKGFSPALFYRGMIFYRGLNYEKRISLLTAAAHNGYIRSYSAISYLAMEENDYLTAYTYLYLEYLVSGHKPSYINNTPQGLYQFDSLSERDIKKAIEKAEELYKNVEPEIYFDEDIFYAGSGGITLYK